MAHVRMLLALVLGLGLASQAAAKGPVHGVFGRINGHRFGAVSTGPDDPCVFGVYQATGGVVFTAMECRGHRVRRPKRNLQQVVFTCGVIDPPKQPPFDAACIAAVYSESRLRHFTLRQRIWTASTSFGVGPDGQPVETSAVQLHVDSFDGTYVRGSFSGVFDLPQSPGQQPAQAPIDGSVVFDFAVKGVE